MASRSNPNDRHILLYGTRDVVSYGYPGRGGSGSRPVPERHRQSHAASLMRQLDSLKQDMAAAQELRETEGVDRGEGLTIEFESFPDVEFLYQSLERVNQGIELLSVRKDGPRVLASVFVPDGKLDHFERLINDYLAEKRDSAGKPRDNRNLIDAIEHIRRATVRSLWTDDPTLFPDDERVPRWWEVWLPVRDNRECVLGTFQTLAAKENMVLANGRLDFPERTVVLLQGTAEQLGGSFLLLNTIAELRQVHETAEFFTDLSLQEQHEWLEDLLARVDFPEFIADVPYVCVVDTGVNIGNPLLAAALDDADMHSVEPGWGKTDTDGHGTNMAGMALLGDLSDALATTHPLHVGHRLESVKILRANRSNSGDADFHGYLTMEAIARPEVSQPKRRRIFSLAISTDQYSGNGRPSAWSAAVDRLAVGNDLGGTEPRLIIVSTGNLRNRSLWTDYPDSNDVHGIEDPGQSWNALTVGAYTELSQLPDGVSQDAQVVAPAGALSPFSRTSVPWPHKDTPLKPDVVFEGGNVYKDAYGAFTADSLSLLTTSGNPTRRLFDPFTATSAATALASHTAAQIAAQYPDLWPETIRGLVVHSAQWTEPMLQMYLPEKGQPKKGDYALLVRRCGFGVPDLERALRSVANSLTLIVQDSLQPFAKGKSNIVFRDMHFHRLPWPFDELEALGEQDVEMRVTLSYFVEPNPSARGWHSRYSYASHGLRFDLRRPAESVQNFRERINKDLRTEGVTRPHSSDDRYWALGVENRARGSIHSDVWQGPAAELASRGLVGVFPTTGWWKTRPGLKRYDCHARYALLISIHAPDIDVDLRAEVEQRIQPDTTIRT